MDLYLVRHAIAYNRDPEAWPDDAERPLTRKGGNRVRRSARGLKKLVPSVDVVLSSPFARAWQTAEILAREAGWPSPFRCEALEVGQSPDAVVEALRNHATVGRVALVGHEPGLHELAGYLLCGQPATTMLEFKKGGAARLRIGEDVEPGSAVLLWLATAKHLRALS